MPRRSAAVAAAETWDYDSQQKDFLSKLYAQSQDGPSARRLALLAVWRKRRWFVVVWLACVAVLMWRLVVYILGALYAVDEPFVPRNVTDVEFEPSRVGFFAIPRWELPGVGGPAAPDLWSGAFFRNASSPQGRRLSAFDDQAADTSNTSVPLPPAPAHPLPTNKWWSNLIMPPGHGDKHGVNQAPYLVRVVADVHRIGLHVHAPYSVTYQGGDGDFVNTVEAYSTPFGPDAMGWFVGISIPVRSAYRHLVEDFDELSVTKVFHYADRVSKRGRFKTLRSWLVRGSPFMTLEWPQDHFEARPVYRNRNANLPNTILWFGTPGEQYNCTEDTFANQTPVESDLFYIQLMDGSEWGFVFSAPVVLRCHYDSRSRHSLLKSDYPLAEGTIVRVGLMSACKHEHVVGQYDMDKINAMHMEGIRRLCDETRELKRSTFWSSAVWYPVGGTVEIDLKDGHADLYYRYRYRRLPSTTSSLNHPKAIVLLHALHRWMLLPASRRPRPLPDPTSTDDDPVPPHDCIDTVHGEQCAWEAEPVPVESASHSHEVVVAFRRLPYSQVSWHGPAPIPKQWALLIREQLIRDVRDKNIIPPQRVMRGRVDPIEFGQVMYKFGRMALIADALGKSSKRELNYATNYARDGLERWLNFTGGNKFMYDTHWGGLVPCGCDVFEGKCYNKGPMHWETGGCPALQMADVDSGMGFYSSHIIAFGYLIFLAAVTARFSPNFLTRRIQIRVSNGVYLSASYHDIVWTWIRNVATPGHIIGQHTYSNATLQGHLSGHFAPHRHKDWWYLNSWTSGMMPDGRGPRTDSASEIAFAYHAIGLYALAVGDKDLHTWASFLTGTEILFANAFMHINSASETYPVSVRRMMRHVGAFYDMEASYSPAYSTSPNAAHGTQLLPLSPLSFEALEPKWMLWAWDRFEGACKGRDCVDSGWVSALAAAHVYVRAADMKTSLKKFQAIDCFRERYPACRTLSRSIMYWWGAMVEAVDGALGVSGPSPQYAYNFTVF
ncbi:unnamed protein product [Vitrella brassicaformis CCMP3155]|uniref:glucan endo-1,3-beta-D-glucosidase n=2 Tax=Vitrella brassicaformis TaxID=1169539 RepID=A0A0G4ENH2_VITBC|nr:unnamed protein product [Vitrella brassicaformis CCMP3155]|eukprot:CEL99133.1 unnamed protein product [Vitrella brassicaformis CCMP3155]